MGIPKLLDLLDSVKIPVELKDFSGKKIAVDGHCWIYNAMGIYKFRVKRGTTNPLWLNYLGHRLDDLKEHNITPIIVFDGQKVPVKQRCYSKRQQKYTKPPETEHSLPSAWESYELIKQSVELLKKRNIEYIIAPFEADPQLTHLSITNQFDAILSVDSDLLVFGCKLVVFPKRSKQGGYYSICQSDMFKINQPGPTQRHTHINLTQFDATRFRHLCILAGCDYLDGFKLMGLKRLLKLMYEVEDINEIIQRLLAKEHKEGYQRHFENANAGFLYQYVYDPRTQLYMRLNPLPPGKLLFDMDVLGESPRITDVPSHRFNQVDDVDLDGLDVLFESLQIDSAASSPSLVLDVSTLTDDEDDEEDDEGEEVYITDKDMIQVEQAVIDEIALRAIATI